MLSRAPEFGRQSMHISKHTCECLAPRRRTPTRSDELPGEPLARRPRTASSGPTLRPLDDLSRRHSAPKLMLRSHLSTHDPTPPMIRHSGTHRLLSWPLGARRGARALLHSVPTGPTTGRAHHTHAVHTVHARAEARRGPRSQSLSPLESRTISPVPPSVLLAKRRRVRRGAAVPARLAATAQTSAAKRPPCALLRVPTRSPSQSVPSGGSPHPRLTRPVRGRDRR